MEEGLLHITATDAASHMLNNNQKIEIENIVRKLLIDFNLNSYSWHKEQVHEIVCTFAINKILMMQSEFSNLYSFFQEERNNNIQLVKKVADSMGFDAFEFINKLDEYINKANFN